MHLRALTAICDCRPPTECLGNYTKADLQLCDVGAFSSKRKSRIDPGIKFVVSFISKCNKKKYNNNNNNKLIN